MVEHIMEILLSIAAVAIILMVIFFTMALIYVVVILKRIKDVLTMVRRETTLITEDIDQLRDRVKEEGFKFRHLWRFFKIFYKKSRK